MGHTEMLQPADLGKPIGLYSHAALVRQPEALLHVAGQLAVDREGACVGAGDFAVQVRQVFENLGKVLRAAGMAFGDVVKFTTYLVDPENIADFYDVRAQLFPELFDAETYPPNTLLVVQRLVRPEFLIEVEGVAARV